MCYSTKTNNFSPIKQGLMVFKTPAPWNMKTPPRGSCAAPTTTSTTASATTTLRSETASTLPFTARQGTLTIHY